MKRASLLLFIWVAVLLVCIYIIATRLSVSSDLGQFLPPIETSDSTHSGMAQSVLNDLVQGGHNTLIMIALEGDNAEELASQSRQLVAQLEASQHFKQVKNGSKSVLPGKDSLIYRYRYLLSKNTNPETFSQPALKETFTQRLDDLQSAQGSIVKRYLRSDPTMETLSILNQWRGDTHLKKKFGVWFDQKGESALILAEMKLTGYDIDQQEFLLNYLETTFESIRKQTDVTMIYSGPARFAVSTRNQIRTEIKWLSTIASLFIVLILAVAYRRIRLVLLSSLPLATALVVALAVSTTIFSSVHGITIAFGMTLIGVSIDYPVHSFSHWINNESLSRSLQKIWPTLLLSVVTTCLGYLSLLLTDFSGLKQLGVFTIVGLISAALVTRYVLPNLAGSSGVSLNVERCTQRLQHGRVISPYIALLVLLFSIVLIWMIPSRWETNLTALSPLPEQARKVDQHLRDKLAVADLNHIALIQASDIQKLLELQESLEPGLLSLQKSGAIDSFESLHKYLPSFQQQQRRQAFLPQSSELSKRIIKAQHDLPFQSGTFEQFILDVSASKSLEPIELDGLEKTIVGLKLSGLYLKNDSGYVGLIRFSNVTQPERLIEWAEQQKNSQIQYVNIRQLTETTLNRFRSEAMSRLMWGAGIIALFLLLALKPNRRFVSVLATLYSSILITLVLLNSLGEVLSLFHLLALVLVAGIGLDYSLFFSRPDHQLTSRCRTLHGIVVCMISTVSVFGILSFSSIPVLHAMGQTVALGVAISFVLSYWLARQPVIFEQEEL